MRRAIAGLALLLLAGLLLVKAYPEDCVHILPEPEGRAARIDFGGSAWVKGLHDTTTSGTFPNGYVKIVSWPADALYDKPGQAFTSPGEVPPDGVSVPVYLSGVYDGVYSLSFSIEYDSTLFAYDGFTTGNFAAPDYLISSADNTSPYCQTTFCETSEVPGHGTKKVVYLLGMRSPEYFVLEPDQPRHKIVTFHFLFRSNPADPDGALWETSSAVSIACSPTVGCGSSYPTLQIAFEDGHTGLWGDPGINIRGGSRCFMFDQSGYSGGTGTLTWCPHWSVGRDCINCPGCNYWGECYDDKWVVWCQKWPCDPNWCPCNLVDP